MDRTLRGTRLEPLGYQRPAADTPPWKLTRLEYVGPAPMNTNQEFVRRSERELRRKLLPEDAVLVTQDMNPAVEIWSSASSRGVFMRDRGTGRLCGQIMPMPLVLPEFRGRGYGAVALFLKDEIFGRLRGTSYTREGLANRHAVHRLHLEAARARGDAIPRRVMADYRFRNGRAVLRQPWTAEDQVRANLRYLNDMNWISYERAARPMKFETAFSPRRILTHEELPERGNALFLAQMLRRAPGLQLMKLRCGGGPHFAALDAERDLLIDIHGVRPVANFEEEMRWRSLLWGGSSLLPATPLLLRKVQALEGEALPPGVAEAVEEVVTHLRRPAPATEPDEELAL